MRISTYKIARVTLVFILVFVPLLLFRYFSGTHTEYCPLSHKMSDSSQCLILHAEKDRVLVRHSDKYTNDDYFEIIDGGGSHKFDIPDYDGPETKRFRIRLVEGKDNAVTINGREYVLRSIDKTYN